jgi:2',3'-cyclic-nucleotide 2'-phosphodiesterase (5'-nucleotidase family)
MAVWLIILHVYVLAENPVKLTILHTNDMHAHYLPSKASWIEEEPAIGGFEALSYYAENQRKESPNTLLFDAGDLMTGSIICDIEYKGANGGALIEMMNLIGYDGMAPGNHEFDISVTNFKALEKMAGFPILCANLTKDDSLVSGKPYHIYDVGGLKVGVIGITYHIMKGMVSDPNLEGFESKDPANLVDSLVSEIDPRTDVIIILSHNGLNYDRELARAVGGIDLIVGGHSHEELIEPELVNGVIIVQAGSNCQFLGRVDMTIENDSVIDYRGELIPMLISDISPDPLISEMVSGFSSEIDELYGKVIGKLDNRWETISGEETIIGDWVTDVLRKKLYTDVAIVNSGAIRRSLDRGDITVRDIIELLPFNNQIVTFGCSGEQLQSIARQNIGFDAEGYIYPLQISGLTYTWRQTGSGYEIAELLVNGKPLDMNKVYTVASIDYVVIYNSIRYFGFKIRAYIKTRYRLPELIIDEIETNGFAKKVIGDRFRKIN